MSNKSEQNSSPDVIELQPIMITSFDVTIAGTTDLILNKMNDEVRQQLLDKQKDRVVAKGNGDYWKCVITSMHWYNGTPEVFSEESFYDALENNRPCIHAFGLKKSLCNAVVRNSVDKYSTKFDACVNIVAKNNLIPISFKEHYIDEKLLPSRTGSPVRSVQNRFSGWSATFTVECIGKEWVPLKVINLINLAGFGLGIGSGRSSSYGRYRVVNKSEDTTV